MRFVFIIIALGLATIRAIAAEVKPRSFVVEGTITNTTIGVSAGVRLEMLITGEAVSASIKTELPLAGSGVLHGRWLSGWCTLEGKLQEGFLLRMRGVADASDFRGTYVVEVPGSTAQFGRFEMKVQSHAPIANGRTK